MTSIRLIINRLPPSPDRLFLGRSLFREDFDIFGSDGYRVRKAAEFHADFTIRPDSCDAPGEADERAFFDSLSHQPYLALGGAEAR